MMAGGHGDHGRIDLGDELMMVRKDFRSHTASDGLGLLPIDIRHADQIDFRQTGQNPGMLFAQVPDSDHGHPQAGHEHLRQSVASGWWPVARKKRRTAY